MVIVTFVVLFRITCWHIYTFQHLKQSDVTTLFIIVRSLSPPLFMVAMLKTLVHVLLCRRSVSKENHFNLNAYIVVKHPAAPFAVATAAFLYNLPKPAHTIVLWNVHQRLAENDKRHFHGRHCVYCLLFVRIRLWINRLREGVKSVNVWSVCVCRLNAVDSRAIREFRTLFHNSGTNRSCTVSSLCYTWINFWLVQFLLLVMRNDRHIDRYPRTCNNKQQ